MKAIKKFAEKGSYFQPSIEEIIAIFESHNYIIEKCDNENYDIKRIGLNSKEENNCIAYIEYNVNNEYYELVIFTKQAKEYFESDKLTDLFQDIWIWFTENDNIEQMTKNAENAFNQYQALLN